MQLGLSRLATGSICVCGGLLCGFVFSGRA